MNQRVMFHFDLLKDNNKFFSFSVLPGTSFDEIDAAFDEFKQEFAKIREIAAENEKKAQESQGAVVDQSSAS